MSNQGYASLEQMKENMDSNIFHGLKDHKSSCEKQSISNKRQAFRDVNARSQSRAIKKNAYIMDSDQQCSSGNKPNTQQSFRSQQLSLGQVSEIMGSLSKQSSIPVSPKQQAPTSPLITTCLSHCHNVYLYNFCIQCGQYLMCPQCIKQVHSNHMILTFSSQQQTKTLTKQFLIQKIEQTLQRLKSKQNDIKNKSTEMQLILSNVKRLQQQVMNKLQIVFRDIADAVRTVYDKEALLYDRRIDEFYRQYNGVGDQLRENLLNIIDQSFQLKNFDVGLVRKDPPVIPDGQINKFKSVLEKTKAFYRAVIESIEELKLKVIDKSKIVKGTKGLNAKANSSMRKQQSTKKYEKFLSDTCYQNENHTETNKTSLIKILDTLSK